MKNIESQIFMKRNNEFYIKIMM